MTRKEAAGVIKFEKACVLRQDTPQCHRDCKKCDLLLPTEDVLTAYDMAIKALEQQYLNPEADREESKAYCAECDHVEMCSWYPHDGCEWLKTDRYNAGYNAAKREIALSGEYERAYERG